MDELKRGKRCVDCVSEGIVINLEIAKEILEFTKNFGKRIVSIERKLSQMRNVVQKFEREILKHRGKHGREEKQTSYRHQKRFEYAQG